MPSQTGGFSVRWSQVHTQVYLCPDLVSLVNHTAGYLGIERSFSKLGIPARTGRITVCELGREPERRALAGEC